MQKPILFLLAPGFEDNGRREYCSDCATVWGVLSYFPAIKEAVEIRYETISHPREGLVDYLVQAVTIARLWYYPRILKFRKMCA